MRHKIHKGLLSFFGRPPNEQINSLANGLEERVTATGCKRHAAPSVGVQAEEGTEPIERMGGHTEGPAAANCSENALTECFAQHAQLSRKDLRSPMHSAFVPSGGTCNTYSHYSRK